MQHSRALMQKKKSLSCKEDEPGDGKIDGFPIFCPGWSMQLRPQSFQVTTQPPTTPYFSQGAVRQQK